MDKALDEIKDFLNVVKDMLEELFQSGFYTVHDSTLQQMKAAVPMAEQYGMEKLRELLSGLSRALEEKRHRMDGRDASIYEMYGALVQYLYICKKRLEIDQAAEGILESVKGS